MKLLYSIGNKKIGKDTMIINITSATDCSSKALGLCKIGSKCYALKAEHQYPACLPFRRRQTLYWDLYNAKAIASDILEVVIKKDIQFIRFQESGDFRNQNDVDKMYKIADLLGDKVRCYTYTARKDLSFQYNDNLVVNGSGFMLDNRIDVVRDLDNTKPLCIGDCRQCDLCKYTTKSTIQIKLH